MRILLFGEYSRFHNSLKEGLQKLGHDVTIVGRGDGFKQFPIDIDMDPTFFKTNKIPHYFRQAIFRLLKFDIATFEVVFKFYKNKKHLKNYDVVQLVNEAPLNISRNIEKKLLQFVFERNDHVFLSACGDDYVFINYILNGSLPYHILTPFQKNPSLKGHFTHSNEYIKASHKKLHDFVFENIKAVIPGDLDYWMAYKGHPLAADPIPYPINTERNKFEPLDVEGKIKIFHGVNQLNYYKKGNDLFDQALQKITDTHGDKVEIIRVVSLPYDEYIQKYREAHIILDQVYSYDQGYNALEGMAKGKVVLTGAEKIFEDNYSITYMPCINVKPEVDHIYEALEMLIKNPDKIVEIGKNARKFIEQEHHYVDIAKRYLAVWNA